MEPQSETQLGCPKCRFSRGGCRQCRDRGYQARRAARAAAGGASGACNRKRSAVAQVPAAAAAATSKKNRRGSTAADATPAATSRQAPASLSEQLAGVGRQAAVSSKAAEATGSPAAPAVAAAAAAAAGLDSHVLSVTTAAAEPAAGAAAAVGPSPAFLDVLQQRMAHLQEQQQHEQRTSNSSPLLKQLTRGAAAARTAPDAGAACSEGTQGAMPTTAEAHAGSGSDTAAAAAAVTLNVGAAVSHAGVEVANPPSTAVGSVSTSTRSASEEVAAAAAAGAAAAGGEDQAVSHPAAPAGSPKKQRQRKVNPYAALLPGVHPGVPSDPRVTCWVPPASPLGLLEEELWQDPWKLLLACVLLNKTSGKQVRRVIWRLFELCPTPQAAVAADVAQIRDIIQPLGLFNKRAVAVQRFSQDYTAKEWRCPTELHGIGKYAADAYYMFCRGLWREVAPDDKDLKAYHQFLTATDGLGMGLEAA